MPEGSPTYDPSGAEPEWNAFVSVNSTPSTSIVAAFVRRVQLALVDAVLAEPAGELDERDDCCAVLLREVDGVADVVAVAVRDRDDVGALGGLLALGTLRIAVQERVDVDALAAGRVEPEGRVAEPGQRRVCHRSPFAGEDASVTRKDRPRRGRTSTADGLAAASAHSRARHLLADSTGLHRLAFYLVLLAVVGAARRRSSASAVSRGDGRDRACRTTALRSRCSCSAPPSARTQRSAGMCRGCLLRCRRARCFSTRAGARLAPRAARSEAGAAGPRRACRSPSSPRRPYGCSGWAGPLRAPGSTARTRPRAPPRHGRSSGFASRFVMCASATSFRKRSVARLIAALPRRVFFVGRAAARRIAAMSASSFAIARGETHCFGDVTTSACFVAPHAVRQRAAQHVTTRPRVTTPA